MEIVTSDLHMSLIPSNAQKNKGIHPVLCGIIPAAIMKSLEDEHKCNAKLLTIKSKYVCVLFYFMQSMATS
jgi:hypothetical protein